VLSASTSATLNQLDSVLGASDSAKILTDLNVLGDTNLNNLGVTGGATIGMISIDGGVNASASASASISTLGGSLKLQASALSGNLDIFNGKVTIDPQGNLVTQTLTTKELKIDTTAKSSATVGEAIIPAGATSVIINTTAAHASSHVFTTAKTKISSPLTVTAQNEGTSFKVEIDGAQATDVKFSWFIVNEAQ
jgi:hypothetical protein